MLNHKRSGRAVLPQGGQQVYLSERERGLLWGSAVAFGAACLAMLAVLALTLALGDLPPLVGALLAVALVLPGRLAQNRLLAVADDLRAGTAVLQTARLEGIRRAGSVGERCYAAFSEVGEFSLDAAAYQRLQRRVGRRYRIVYGPSSRILLTIEPLG